MNKTTILIIGGLALALAACETATTEKIGSPVEPIKLTNAPGMNSFAINMNSVNGIPESVLVSLGKDETEVSFKTTYEFPDGRRVTWDYNVGNSKGSDQTRAVLATMEAIATAQAETAQALGPEAMKALVEGLKIGFGAP